MAALELRGVGDGAAEPHQRGVDLLRLLLLAPVPAVAVLNVGAMPRAHDGLRTVQDAHARVRGGRLYHGQVRLVLDDELEEGDCDLARVVNRVVAHAVRTRSRSASRSRAKSCPPELSADVSLELPKSEPSSLSASANSAPDAAADPYQ